MGERTRHKKATEESRQRAMTEHKSESGAQKRRNRTVFVLFFNVREVERIARVMRRQRHVQLQ